MSRRTGLFLTAIPLLLCMFFLAACGGGTKSEPSAQAVEAYLQALVAEDANRLPSLVCKNFEQDARRELDSFIGVKASLKDMGCKTTSNEGGTTLVECQGAILATYGNEQQELTLAGRTYQVAQEGGEWRVCGYR